MGNTAAIFKGPYAMLLTSLGLLLKTGQAIKVTDGAALGKVLQSDASGICTLQTLTGFYNKIVGTGFFATITAATPAAGDKILVLNSYSSIVQEAITVSDCLIEFAPNVKLTWGAITGGLRINGNRNRIINPYFVADLSPGGGTLGSMLLFAGDDNEARFSRFEVVDAGTTVTNAATIVSGNRNYVEGSEWASAGSITNKISDSGTDSDWNIRGSAA